MAKGNSIYNNKIKVVLLLTFMIFTSFIMLEKQTKVNENEKLLLRIDFQERFLNDTVELKINDCVVFDSVIMSTDPLTGFTERINVVMSQQKNPIIYWHDKKISCNMNFNNIILNIKLNNRREKLTLKIDKGLYIGINKSFDGSLRYVQSNKAFVYE